MPRSIGASERSKGHRGFAPARLIEWDRRHLWHPFTQQAEWSSQEPVIIASGRGVWLMDIRGRRLLDGNSSLWVNVWGHNEPRLNRALARQLSKIAHATFLGLTHEPAVRLAKMLIALAPPGLTRVFYSDNGSTSVEIAVKMAYQYWQLCGRLRKSRFVSMQEGYHGDTLGSVSVGGIALFHERFRDLLFKGIHVTPGDFDEIERVLRHSHGSIAAVVMEPLIQGASGMRIMPAGYLAHVARLCRKYDVLLILDEVATGFGRSGTMFACEQENVSPDFLCVAKSITGGYLPLAATLAKEKIFRRFLGRYDQFKTFFHGHTYTANPLACAVAIENLKLYAERKLLSNVRARAEQLRRGLLPLQNHPHVKEVRQLGLMVGIELIKTKPRRTEKSPRPPFTRGGIYETSNPSEGVSSSITPFVKGGRGGFIPYPPRARMGLKVCEAAIRRGVWLRPLGDVIVLMPPMAITKKELSFLIGVARASVDDVL